MATGRKTKSAATKKTNPMGYPPSRLVQLFSPDEWEAFVEEACLCRCGEGKQYVAVRKLGGPGDAGRDIEALLSAPRLEDTWDLYQGKHYQSTISRSAFYPELAKFFRHVFIGTYPEPRTYFLCAPKNCGPELYDLLHEPQRFKDDFLAAAREGEAGLKDIGPAMDPKLVLFIQNFDFSKIKEYQTRDLITLHSENAAAHYKLFGVEPPRPADPGAPSVPSAIEDEYVRQLVLAYEEHAGRKFAVQEIISDDEYSDHFQGCRQEFYCAEGLRLFSRDVFKGEFDRLLENMHVGLKRAVSSPRLKTGMERLDHALQLAPTLPVTDSLLANRLRPGDLPGTCHHLANVRKLKWVK